MPPAPRYLPHFHCMRAGLPGHPAGALSGPENPPDSSMPAAAHRSMAFSARSDSQRVMSVIDEASGGIRWSHAAARIPP